MLRMPSPSLRNFFSYAGRLHRPLKLNAQTSPDCLAHIPQRHGNHSATATTSHASVATLSTATIEWSGASCHTTAANAMSPTLPMAAPAASTPATWWANRFFPDFSRAFFSSVFSSRVAAAGKIAGAARNRPPTPGPKCLAMIPARAVTAPPKMKRTIYSCHSVHLRAATLISIFTISAQ